MKKNILIFILTFFIANNLYAQDLISALSDAFKNNSRIKKRIPRNSPE